MDRRGFIFGSAAAAATFKTSFAQDAAYPTHAIIMVNPFPPGGAADVVGRPLAAVMEPMVQKPVVIETKSGAAGAVGAQFAAISLNSPHSGTPIASASKRRSARSARSRGERGDDCTARAIESLELPHVGRRRERTERA